MTLRHDAFKPLMVSAAFLFLLCVCADAAGKRGDKVAPAAASSINAPAQLSPLSPDAPQDKPRVLERDAIEAFRAATAPYREQAKAAYPAAKSRYLAGLPAGQHFYVTVTLHSAGKQESVFLEVLSIKDGVVRGLLASQMQLLTDYQPGQAMAVSESDIEDWTITYPNGHEEGNFVGKFLDTYQPPGG